MPTTMRNVPRPMKILESSVIRGHLLVRAVRPAAGSSGPRQVKNRVDHDAENNDEVPVDRRRLYGIAAEGELARPRPGHYHPEQHRPPDDVCELKPDAHVEQGLGDALTHAERKVGVADGPQHAEA